MADEIVSKPDHGESIIDLLNAQSGIASPRLQIFFDDITRILDDLSSASNGGAIDASNFDPSSIIYRPSTGTSILPAVIDESEVLGRLPSGEIKGLGFVDVWSILGNGTTNITINSTGGANAFTVETSSSTKMFEVNGANNLVSISRSGISGTDGMLHIIHGTASGGAIQALSSGDNLVIESEFEGGMSIINGSNSTGNIYFSSPAYGEQTGNLWFFHDTDTSLPRMGISVREKEYLSIIDAVGALFNRDQDTDIDFQINTLGSAPFLFVDSSANRMGITNASILPTDGLLHLHEGGTAGAVTADVRYDTAVLESNGSAGISLLGGDTDRSGIVWGSSVNGNQAAALIYIPSTTQFFMDVQAVQGFKIDQNQAVFNDSALGDGRGPTSRREFRIETSTQESAFHMTDGGNPTRYQFNQGVSLISPPTQGIVTIRKIAVSGATASTLADSLILESDAEGGLSILVPNDGSAANIYFGAPVSGANAGRVSMVPSTGIMTITATQVNHSNNVGFAGRLDANVTTVIGTTHTAADEHVILVDDDTAAAAVTVTLPTAATADTIYHIKKIGSTANVTVDGNGAETIDGATTAVLTIQYESITLISDGTAWWIL